MMAVNGATGDVRAAVEFVGITKVFAAIRALDNVDVSIKAGEIHALVGENGAGKSTLLGVLSGRLQMTAGSVEVHGEQLRTGDPRASRKAGIAAVYQELTLVPEMSAVANVFLGQTMSRGAILSDSLMSARFRELGETFGASIPPNALASSLPLADQQILEILRGVQSGARILLFDEPTAALAEDEREALWKALRRLQANGTTIVFVSHNLQEVLSLSDTITVLRDGRHVVTAPKSDMTEQDLIRAMVGREVEVVASRTAKRKDTVVLEAHGISVKGRLQDVSLSVHEGEILGLAGLVGSGRSSLLRALAGLEPGSTGAMSIDGRTIAWPTSVRKGLASGIALLTEDRKKALVTGMTVGDNIFMGAVDKFTRAFFISDRKKNVAADAVAQRFRLKGGNARSLVTSLSGGNQQKVLIGKWVERYPRILLVDEPTRGIDVAAKAEILEVLNQLASSGMAIVMASSELEEIIALSNRVLVLRGGRVVAEFDSDVGQLSKKSILERAFEVEVGVQ
jgi:ABC-type sugar transport system ATPase subunit